MKVASTSTGFIGLFKFNIMEIVKAEEFGIEKKQAEQLIGNLPQIKSERDVLSSQFNEIIKLDINNPETAKKAKELRLLIQKNRTQGINVWHKTTKEYFLKGGQFCDAIKRKEIAINERMESDLMQIEKHAEIQEQKRLEELQAKRVKQLSEFVEDAEERDLSSMDDDVWRAFLETKKKQHIDRLEAERKAEEERIAKEKAEAEERERIEKAKALHQERKDKLAPYWNFVPQDNRDMDFSTLTDDEFNERLNYSKSEKEKNDKEIEAQRKENERLKKEAEERERVEREERLKREKLEAELKAKQEEERKAKEAEEARIQAELNKGDADKVKDLISDLESLKSKYLFKSAKNKKMMNDVSILIDKVINHVKN